MDVNKICLLIPILVLSLGTTCAETHSFDQSSSIIEHVQQQVIARTAELGEKINLCDSQRETNPIPEVPYIRLLDMGITKQQLVAAITHLSHRNYALCEGRAREALAYALGTLASIADHEGLNIDGIKGIENYLIYPGRQEIESEIAFSKLSQDVKTILLDSTGDLPFQLLPTLNKNKLIPDR